MRIGELARLTGKSVPALRYYEEVGLLASPQRTASGYRDYEPETVERVRFIGQARERGFSLREIKAVLALYDQGQAPCESVAKAVARKITRLEKQITQLQQRRTTLADTLQLWQSGSLGEAPFCSLLNVSELPPRRPFQMARKIEVFTAGCPLCDETVKLVESLACPNCEVTVYDLREGCATNECRDKAKRYGVRRVPAVVIEGKLASCCEGSAVSAETLRAAGLGVA